MRVDHYEAKAAVSKHTIVTVSINVTDRITVIWKTGNIRL